MSPNEREVSTEPRGPSEELLSGQRLASPAPGDEVVVSGLAGVYPESANVYDLRDNLMNKVDMITLDDRRWHVADFPQVPPRSGKILCLDQFDNAFFGIPPVQADILDPMCRLSLEKTYEAVVDAGLNPLELRGTNTGVFFGCCFAESEIHFYNETTELQYGLLSSGRPAFSQRISYWLRINGPSYMVDTACSSSSFAIDQAYKAIRDGLCDQAIVAGCNLCTQADSTRQFYKLGVVNMEGRCKAFDQDANGYVRSEAVVVMFLQRAKMARRVYATLVHSKTNCDGYKEQGITYPSGKMQQKLLTSFYEECQVAPSQVSWVEAHGTGTEVGDPEECAAIAAVFCPGRTTPLPIASVKSNLGHSEPASGMVGLSKVVIAMETGLIPPNLHFKVPKQGIKALIAGQLQVVTEPQPWTEGLVAFNSFGFGGSNAHVLLRWNEKVKVDGGAPADKLPRLVTVSGRTEKAVKMMLDDIESRPLDAELVGLYHEVHAMATPGHWYRGYGIFQRDRPAVQKIQYLGKLSPPLWLSFSSHDCSEAGSELQALLPLARTLDAVDRVLRPLGVDIRAVIARKQKTRAETCVAITTLQLGLVEVLRSVGLKPDGVTAHSIGHIAALYAEDRLSLEQAVMTSYHVGQQPSDLVKCLKQVIPDSCKTVSADSVADALLETASARDDMPKGAVVMEMLSVDSLLTTLGGLYLRGCTLRLASLYPAVQFPVSRGTPMLSPVIGWNYSRSMRAVYSEDFVGNISRDAIMVIDLKKPADQFYVGHVVDGRNLFPATGYIWLVSEAFAQMNNAEHLSEAVFENIRFQRATTLPKDGTIHFRITIQRISGLFEVEESGAAVVTGRVYIPDDVMREMTDLPLPIVEDDIILNSRDIYKELRLRGYNYTGLFKSVESATRKGERGKIRWNDNWVALMDNMLQLQILSTDSRGLFVPTSIDKLTFNRPLHDKIVEQSTADGKDTVLDVTVNHEVKIIRCGGIEILGLRASAITRRKTQGEPVLERYQLIPYTSDEDLGLSEEQVLRLLVHIALENKFSVTVKAVEFVDDHTSQGPLMASYLLSILGDLPLMQANVNVVSLSDHPLMSELSPDIRVTDNTSSDLEDCMLALGSNVLARPARLAELLRSAEYVIARESCAEVELPADLQLVAEYKLGEHRILMLKRQVPDLLPPILIPVKEDEWAWIEHVKWALSSKQTGSRRIVLISQCQPLSGIIGLFNCLRKEPGGDNLRCYFIRDPDTPLFEPSLPFYSEQLSLDLAVNVFSDGKWCSYRHLLLEGNAVFPAQHAYANTLVRGDVASLRWLQGQLDPDNVSLSPDKMLVHVYYSAMNFRDVMIATGKLATEVITMNRLQQDCLQGFEFAGRTSEGKRVMGMSVSQALSNIVTTDKEGFLWEFPDSWTLEDAATVPVVYGTAYFALKLIGRMARGDSVLIHAGSGGVGQAAINIALYEGCTVYTTVGTPEKREFIKQRFPQLHDRHIGNSRDTSFEQLVLSETDGRGVDLVLNSLAEEKLQASVRCLATGGRFLEIGKFDLANNNTIDMSVFLRETSFHGIMLDNLFEAPLELKRPLKQIIQDGINSGAIRPLTRTVFQAPELEQAFRYMGAGKHIGKVLINIRPEEKVITVIPKPFPMLALPRFSCDPAHSYIIAGGLGGFGLELADWLVLRGARQLVLTSRTGLRTGYQSARVALWRSYDANVSVSTADITTEAGVLKLLNEANAMGPVAAIFNLAVVLVDALFENQSEASFSKSAGPKATATRLLDAASRRLCPHLSHFVCFSSVSCGRGNAGQTNYAMSNSVMERICERRREQGYPGLAVQWGAVGEVGLVAEMQEDQHEMVIGGTLQQRISSCLHVLDGFLCQPHAVVASMVVAEKKTGVAGANMLETVANILGFSDLKTVSYQTTLAELGMDSMTAVEIKQMLEREYQVFLTPQELRALTFAKVSELSEAGVANVGSAGETCEYVNAVLSDDLANVANMLFRNFGSEATASDPWQELPSLGQRPTLFLIPGIEGMSSVFTQLAAMLSCRTVALQLGFEEQPDKIAEKLLPLVLSQLAAEDHFLLLGYSFGSLVAMHLTRMLEAAGRQGRLILIDGAPDFLLHIVNSSTVGEDMQVAVLTNFIRILQPHNRDNTKIVEELSGLATLSERIHYAVTFVPDTEYSYEYLQNIGQAYIGRINAIINFCWPVDADKFKTAVTLVRPTYPGSNFEDDYSFSKFCEEPVTVQMYNSNHNAIIESPLLADFINSKILN